MCCNVALLPSMLVSVVSFICDSIDTHLTTYIYLFYLLPKGSLRMHICPALLHTGHFIRIKVSLYNDFGPNSVMLSLVVIAIISLVNIFLEYICNFACIFVSIFLYALHIFRFVLIFFKQFVVEQ